MEGIISHINNTSVSASMCENIKDVIYQIIINYFNKQV